MPQTPFGLALPRPYLESDYAKPLASPTVSTQFYRNGGITENYYAIRNMLYGKIVLQSVIDCRGLVKIVILFN